MSKLTKKLDNTKGAKKDQDKENIPLSLIPEVREMLSSIGVIISQLISASEESKLSEDKVSNLESRLRIQEDVSDHHHQRSLRGKFFVTFSGETPCTTEKVLISNGSDVISYTSDLIHSKYRVSISHDQFKSCHHTKKGLVFRLHDLNSRSAYSELVQAIKNGIGKDNKSFYVNFSLTPRRAALLYDLRKGRKELKLEKFYSDSNGSLSFILNAKDPITRITSLSIREGNSNSFHLKTFSPDELRSTLFPVDESLLHPDDSSSTKEDGQERGRTRQRGRPRKTSANSNFSTSQNSTTKS